VYVASQRLEQLLELMANDGDTRPMVVTSKDRLDIVMGLLASQVCAEAYCRLRPHAPQQGHTCAVRWCQGRVCWGVLQAAPSVCNAARAHMHHPLVLQL
jgi:hypothetical protein